MTGVGVIVCRGSSRVELGGNMIGMLHFPYEEHGRRVARKGFKLVIAGKVVGIYKKHSEAIAAAEAWEPSDDLERDMVRRYGAKT